VTDYSTHVAIRDNPHLQRQLQQPLNYQFVARQRKLRNVYRRWQRPKHTFIRQVGK
jgi:hypothetical protein